MNRVKGCFVLMAACVALSGCVESTTVVQVNPDGSGAVLVREYFSDDVHGMLGGVSDMMTQMMEGLTEGMGGEAEVKTSFDLSSMSRTMLDSKLQQFGPDVVLKEARDVTNARGWKGHHARFEFTDVNTLQLGGGSTSVDSRDSQPINYVFKFTPGDPAVLNITAESEALLDDSASDGAQHEAMPEMTDLLAGLEGVEAQEAMAGLDGLDGLDGMAGMDGLAGLDGAGMMGNMFQGMRISYFVQVQGTLVETDASHRSTARDNVIALMDFRVDEMLENPAALGVLMSNQPDAMQRLQKMGVSGLLMEEPNKTITVEFR